MSGTANPAVRGGAEGNRCLIGEITGKKGVFRLSEVEITVRDHGPYLVSGSFRLLDAEGNAFETKGTVALCRCGRSENKPFCDGSHKQNFESAPRAK